MGRESGGGLRRYYVWEPRQRGISIRLKLDTLDRIRATMQEAPPTAPQRGLEVGGVLLGRVLDPDQRTIVVEDFEQVPCEHRRGPSYFLSGRDRQVLKKRLWRLAARRDVQPVGFFRSHTRAGLYLDEDDFSAARDYFAGPLSVFLLVRPSDSDTPVAGFFFWEEGDIHRSSTCLSFPFDRSALEFGDHPLIEEPTGPARDGAKPAAPRAARRPAAAASWPQPLSWRSISTAFASAAAVILLMAGIVTWQRTSTTPLSASLGLAVERAGSALRLVWNRNHPAVRDADRGVLLVKEGAAERRIEIPKEQLSTGSMYVKAAPDMDVRLDVYDGKKPVSESLTVVPEAAPQRQRADSGTRAVELPIRAPLDPAVSKRRPRRFTPPSQNLTADRSRLLEFPQLPAPTSFQTPLMLGSLPSKPPQSAVFAEPVAPSILSRVVEKIPGLRRIQRNRYKAGERFQPARVVHKVTPPPASRASEEGEPIDVKILIDKNGRVKEAELVSKTHDRALADMTLRAANQWRFEPARLNDRPTSSEMILHFQFGGNEAPVQAGR